MARLKTRSTTLPDRIRQSLTEGLALGGIRAKIETESVPGTRLHRVLVTAPLFRTLRPSERQDLVWRIIAETFNYAEQLQISMIMTLTPNEMRGDWDEAWSTPQKSKVAATPRRKKRRMQ